MTDIAFPLFERFPALRSVPRVVICELPSPVDRVEVEGVPMWIKRDDLNATVCGGNKARVLEFLLAGVHPGETVLTVGGEGSTHVLAAATHASRLGATTVGLRWRHDMNPTAERIAALSRERCAVSTVYATSVGAIVRAQLFRLTHAVHYVPLGGSVPLGVLAQVNAALELNRQVRAGILPAPGCVVVPLGSGGTTAGLALGFAIAGLNATIVGVQVAPTIVANRIHVKQLVTQTARMIERMTGERLPRPHTHRLHLARDMYGGAYGRLVPRGVEAARQLERTNGVLLDQTYSAKAFAVALAYMRERRDDQQPVLFWNTFDGRVL